MTVDTPTVSELIRRGFVTTAATLGAGLLSAPIAYWYWGELGLALLAAFAGSMFAAIWIVLAAHWQLARKDHQVAGAMTAMVVRLFLPLSVCLAIVALANDEMTKNTVFLCVPMYVTMLAVDTFQAIAAVPKSSCNPCVSPAQAVSCSGIK